MGGTSAPGAPGRFELQVDGAPLTTTFGTEGAAWHWQDGGLVTVGATARLTLHDLTGFEGRCDAILFSRDASYEPPDDGESPWRVVHRGRHLRHRRARRARRAHAARHLAGLPVGAPRAAHHGGPAVHDQVERRGWDLRRLQPR